MKYARVACGTVAQPHVSRATARARTSRKRTHLHEALPLQEAPEGSNDLGARHEGAENLVVHHHVQVPVTVPQIRIS